MIVTFGGSKNLTRIWTQSLITVSDEYLHSNSLEEKLVLTSLPDEVASFCGPQTTAIRGDRGGNLLEMMS